MSKLKKNGKDCKCCAFKRQLNEIIFKILYIASNEKKKTSPKALQTQALNTLTSCFGLVWWV